MIPETSRVTKNAADDVTRYLFNIHVLIPVRLDTDEEIIILNTDRLERVIAGKSIAPLVNAEQVRRNVECFLYASEDEQEPLSERRPVIAVSDESALQDILLELLDLSEAEGMIFDAVHQLHKRFPQWEKGEIIRLLKMDGGKHIRFVEHEGFVAFSLDERPDEVLEAFHAKQEREQRERERLVNDELAILEREHRERRWEIMRLYADREEYRVRELKRLAQKAVKRHPHCRDRIRRGWRFHVLSHSAKLGGECDRILHQLERDYQIRRKEILSRI